MTKAADMIAKLNNTCNYWLEEEPEEDWWAYQRDHKEAAILIAHQERRIEALREAVLGVVAATRAYLPPDGITEQECINRVLEATDNQKINPFILEVEHDEKH